MLLDTTSSILKQGGGACRARAPPGAATAFLFKGRRDAHISVLRFEDGGRDTAGRAPAAPKRSPAVTPVRGEASGAGGSCRPSGEAGPAGAWDPCVRFRELASAPGFRVSLPFLSVTPSAGPETRSGLPAAAMKGRGSASGRLGQRDLLWLRRP